MRATQRRRTLVVLAAVVASVAWSMTVLPSVQAAPGPGTEQGIFVPTSSGTVSGIAVTNTTDTLTPAFSTATHDYALHCQAGSNTVTFNVTAGSVTTPYSETLAENQALIVQEQAGNQYWIRCLPHDFPAITAATSGAGPTPGYYMTGQLLQPTPSTEANYAMILDTNGTPVWYQSVPEGAVNVELLPNDTVAWFRNTSPETPSRLFQLDSQSLQSQPVAVQPPDYHELLQMSNGDRMQISIPLTTCPANCIDTTKWNGADPRTFIDCVVSEVDAGGNLVWSWDAYNHVSVNETTIAGTSTVNGTTYADPYHCNSLDVDPAAADPRLSDVLVSMRDTSAVYRVNRENGAVPRGQVVWKLGGDTPNTPDNGQLLTITNDPETTVSGQHDARFEPNGDVSLFDDHTPYNVGTGIAAGAARAVEYHVNTSNANPAQWTAALDWSYANPDGASSLATGTFRRYGAGADNIIGWGFHGPRTPSSPGQTMVMMTEVDGSQPAHPLLTFSLQEGEFEYRWTKIAPSAININLLRETAGLSPSPGTPSAPAKVVHLAKLDGPNVGSSAVEVSDSTIWIEKGQSGDTLGPPQLAASNGAFYGSVGTYMADVDGQGKASALAINSSDIWMEHNTGNDTFSAPAQVVSQGPFYGGVGTYLADIDGTGKASAVAVNGSDVWVEPNLGNDTFGAPQLAASHGAFYGSVGTYLADIDGPGDGASIVAVNSDSVWVEHNQGGDTFGPPQLAASNGNFYGNIGTYVADIDGSGKASIIAVNSNNVWIEPNLGGDTFGPPQLGENGNPLYGSVGTFVADINGSGRASVVAVNDNNIWFLKNQVGDTFTGPQLAVSGGPFFGTH